MSAADRIGNLIPVNTKVEEFIRQNWLKDEDLRSLPPEQQSEMVQVSVAFRTVGDDDHAVNQWAAWGTSTPGDVFPHGRMAHVELLIPVNVGVYVKASVIKKYWVGKKRNPDGTEVDEWRVGCVHCKLTSPEEWRSKYTFLCMNVKRKQMLRGLRFCLLNNGQPFNKAGYYLNLVVPGGVGVKRFYEALMHEPRKYFCSEFVVTALQAMSSSPDNKESNEPGAKRARAYHGTRFHEHPTEKHWMNVIVRVNPARSHPNGVFAALSSAAGVTPGIAHGRGLDV